MVGREAGGTSLGGTARARSLRSSLRFARLEASENGTHVKVLWTSGLRTSGLPLPTSDFHLRTSDFGLGLLVWLWCGSTTEGKTKTLVNATLIPLNSTS